MTAASTLLLRLWQEVGRHAELSESIGSLADILLEAVPLSGLILFELDDVQHAVLPLAEWRKRGEHLHHRIRLHWNEDGYRSLTKWCTKGVPGDLPRGAPWPKPLQPLEAFADGGSVMIAPLRQGEGSGGLAMIVADGKTACTATAKNRVESALEPLSVALANELRLRELARLRAAAEADRRALLSRLGRESLDELIIGADGGLLAVMQRVDLVAASEASVLLLGETGAGKEVIARAIHERSLRHEGPFLRVNCGAIAPELMDSELFGHERGRFTGAVAARRGWFERADGGTLLLDEVAELPPAAQVRLLRVLQEGRIHRVGGEREISVDVRIIAATHRDLARMVQEGGFREDLWYRLAVFPIILPPLRERSRDIPALAEHFVRRAADRLGVPMPAVTTEDVARLQEYDWPGNIRELTAVVERAVILGEGHRLAVAAAMGLMPLRGPAGAKPSRAEPGGNSDEENQLRSFDNATRQHLQSVLQHTRGRVEGRGAAAEILALNPNTLRAKLRRLGIRAADYRSW